MQKKVPIQTDLFAYAYERVWLTAQGTAVPDKKYLNTTSVL